MERLIMTKEKHSEIFKRINNIYEDLNDEKISYDKAEVEIVKLNNYYLSEFKKVLKRNKLSDRTINRTINSIDLFVNTYLCYRFANTIYKGYESYHDFFTYFLIYKCIGSNSVSTVKEHISSFKKFYKFMYENGYISELDYIDNENIIKNFKDEWIEITQNYNDYLDNEMYEDMSFDDYLDDLDEDNSND